MADQPTQADRERALARAKQIVAWGCTLRTEDTALAEAHVALHAENERLRERIADARKRTARRPELWAASITAVLDGYLDQTQEPKMTDTQAETGPSSLNEFTGGPRFCRCGARATRWRPATDGVWCRACGDADAKPDPTWRAEYESWLSEAASDHTTLAAFRRGFQAGRASLAGELESVRKARQTWCDQAAKYRAEIEAEKAAHLKAERERRESNGWLSFLAARCGIGRLQVVTSEELVRGVCDALASARQARVMPSRVALANIILNCTPGVQTLGDCWETADAVLRLLAPTQDSPGASPEGETCPSSERSPSSSKPNSAPSQPPSPLSRETCERTPGTGSSPASKASDTPASRTSSPPRTNPSRSSSASGTGAPCDGKTGTELAAEQARYVPSVGERAVLVASPDRQDQDLVGGAGIVEPTRDPESDRAHWTFIDATGVEHFIHRDATWRRAQPQGEVAIAGDELERVERELQDEASHYFETLIDHKGSINEAEAKQPESDAAWLKRTAEEHTTARPVEVREYNSSVGYGTFTVSSSGQRSLCLSGTVEKRDADAVLRSLTDHRWPLRRHGRPVEPTPGVATPPRRFATPTEAIECLRETIAEECHQEHPAYDAFEALETVEALSKRVADLETRQNGLSVQQAEGSKRLDDLELQGRVLKTAILDTRYGGLRDERAHHWFARIEREERAKAHTSADPPTKT